MKNERMRNCGSVVVDCRRNRWRGDYVLDDREQ